MRLPRGFVKPSYDGRGISSIPATVLELLGVDALDGVPRLDRRCYEEYVGRVDKVVVFVVDSLGYNLLTRCLQKSESLRAWAEGLRLFKLTSVFPSTTASAAVTFSTGRTPQEHGVVGYNVYLKECGTVANMIRLSPAHSSASNELVSLGLKPEAFLGLPTIYELLSEAGVESYVLLKWAYAKSGLSLLTTKGAEVEKYATAADMMVRARKLVEGDGPLLISMYWDGLDLVCHARTPNSEEAEAEAISVLSLLRDVLAKPTGSGAAKSTLLMVTGDHGQSFVGEGSSWPMRSKSC